MVTGVNGQLGYDVVKGLGKKGHTVLATDRKELDITDKDSVFAYIDAHQPDAIIHCAAYTNVDAAEENQDIAYQINSLGAKYLAEAASRIGSKIAYVSTDYVFNGEGTKPYEVDQQPSPLGVYGKTKLAGEEFIKEFNPNYFIVRTAWVFGVNGNNFVKTMLKLAAEREELGVVHDQIGSPTYTVDLAAFLVSLIETDKYGIYHATNEGYCSWYEFALEIFRQAEVSIKVNPLTSEQFPRPAARPKYSVLNKDRIVNEGFSPLQHWKMALSDYLEELQTVK